MLLKDGKEFKERDMASRTFPLDEVITIATGRLVAKRHIDAVYDVLNFMTGDNLFTHQLPRAREECNPYLLTQHPSLRELDLSELDRLLSEAGDDDARRCNAVSLWIENEQAMLGLPDMMDVYPMKKFRRCHRI